MQRLIRSYVKIPNYKLFHTNHPDNKAHGGAAVIIRETIKCIEINAYKTHNIQASTIQIEDQFGFLNISSSYCPLKFNNTFSHYLEYLKTLGNRFIAGGDYNAKNTSWELRLTSKKGKELLDAIKTNKSNCLSTGEPTYWPTDTKKKPDLIDFFIQKNINRNSLRIESNYDLSSDHSPIFLTFLTSPAMEINNGKSFNLNTDWNAFREILRHTLDNNVPLKSPSQVDSAVAYFADKIMEALYNSTPLTKPQKKKTDIPNSIKQAIETKRKQRKQWQTTRHPTDKTILNKMAKDVKEMLKDYENKTMQKFLSNLDTTKNSNYSLWRATSKINKTTPHQHAILNENITGKSKCARQTLQKDIHKYKGL